MASSVCNVPRCQLGRFASTTSPTRSSSAQAFRPVFGAPRLANKWQDQQQNQRGELQVVAADGDLERAMLGDNFGARDPFAAELESNFGDKVLGNFNTEHIIKPPDKIREFVGLTSRRCVPCEGGNVAQLDEKEVERLRQQVPGWRVATDARGAPCIRQEWKVKGFQSGLELMGRIAVIAEEQGHHPDLHLTGTTTLTAELSTHAVGGLTENDFIIAAKINEMSFADLLPPKKARFWA